MDESRKKKHKKPSKKEKSEKPRTVDLEDDEDNPLLDSLPLETVVKVYASLTNPNYECPWQMESSEDVSGSGFIISGKIPLFLLHSRNRQEDHD